MLAVRRPARNSVPGNVVRLRDTDYALPMRLMGIDYGGKRIGIALSDEGGTLAFPREVLKNESASAERIAALARAEGVGVVVVGLSADFKNKENPVMAGARTLAGDLSARLGVPVVFEPEFLTSAEAARIQGEGEKSDASAAALILNSYILRKKNAR